MAIDPITAGTAVGSAGLNILTTGFRNRSANNLLDKQMQTVVYNYNQQQTAIQSQFSKYKEQLETTQFFENIQKNKTISTSQLGAAAGGFSGSSVNSVLKNIKLQDRYRKNIQQRNLLTAIESSKNQVLTNYLQTQSQLEEINSSRPQLLDSITGTVASGIQGGKMGLNIFTGLKQLEELKV